MKRKTVITTTVASLMIAASSTFAAAAYHRYAGPQENGTGITPHNWTLTPVGDQITLGDFPMGGALSPDGNYLIISNDGQGAQSLQVVDTKTKKVIQTIPYKSPEALYFGVAFSPDGKMVYASAGGNNKIRRYSFLNGKLTELNSITLKDKNNTNFYPAGLSVSLDGQFLFIANNLDHSVSKVNLNTGQIVKISKVGKNPYATYLSRERNALYVTNWGESSVTVLNPETMEVEDTITVGLHPNALAENPINGEIYISDSDSDTITVINKQNKVIQKISTKPYNKAQMGTQPDSLTVSDDGKTLYVANAGNNDVAVIDVSGNRAKIKGLIPTAWYPTGLYLVNSDKELMVSNAKGLGAGPNSRGQYIGNMMKGTLSIMDVPNASELKKDTKQVAKNNAFFNENKKEHHVSSPVPAYVGGSSPIKHIIYVIKENRTYDQVFGDLGKGNGDPSLTVFGEKITPNIHKLAKQFVTLDNFYADAEISAQGHNWTTAAKANDYVEKNWMANYSGRHRGYDFEGDNEATYPKAGFLWDNATKSEISFRDYGEFTSYDPNSQKWLPNDPSIGDRFDANYPGWNLDISDLDRLDEWAKEYQHYVDNGGLPQLEIVRLPNDHTYGTRPGKLTPEAMVAQNDYAVGKLVDIVSHSKYWKNTAIFITEDDAQNGWDHIDAHRTESLVISPYTQTGKVDSTFYDSTSMIRTMELILGMKPMSQFDASAIPMFNSFTSHPDFNPYVAEKPRIPLDAVNSKNAPGANISRSMDFSKADHIDEEKMNHILWKATKGKNKPYPNSRK